MPSFFVYHSLTHLNVWILQKSTPKYILKFCQAPCGDGGETLEVNAADVGTLDSINHAIQVHWNLGQHDPVMTTIKFSDLGGILCNEQNDRYDGKCGCICFGVMKFL
jgi:hypothetical protein